MGFLKKLQSENRYVVFFFLYIGFCISYIDRSAIGLALPSVSKDFNLAPTEMGGRHFGLLHRLLDHADPGGLAVRPFRIENGHPCRADAVVHLHLHDRACIDSGGPAFPPVRLRPLRRTVCRILLPCDRRILPA